jgi:pilus assembly protein CpaE
MTQPALAIVAADQEKCHELQAILQAGMVGARIFSCMFPLTSALASDLGNTGAKLVLVDIPAEDATDAVKAIALTHSMLPNVKVVAVGELKDARTVVEAMRAGAADFLERPLDTTQLSKMLLSKPEKQRRGKVYTFVNAKGGSGATTLAVNMALALTSIARRVLLLDLAVPGNAALHLNLRPTYTVEEIYGNMHRMDALLLGSLITKHATGLHLLAGANAPSETAQCEEVASLLDMLTSEYQCVVVDASTRLDPIMRAVCDFSDNVFLVAQADLASMWNAQKVRAYIGEGPSANNRVKLVLNRYRKQPGTPEEEYEKASGCELIWAVPNQYATVSNSIMKGSPVVQHASSELKEQFLRLAKTLYNVPEPIRTTAQEKRNGRSILERVAGLKAFAAGS